MQLLAKFKKIMYMEFRATLNFRKFIILIFFTYLFLLLITKYSATIECQ